MAGAPAWIQAGSVALLAAVAMYVVGRAVGLLLRVRAAERPHPDYRLAWRRWMSAGGQLVSPSFESAGDAGHWRYVDRPEWRREPLTLVRIYVTDLGPAYGHASGDEIAVAYAREP